MRDLRRPLPGLMVLLAALSTPGGAAIGWPQEQEVDPLRFASEAQAAPVPIEFEAYAEFRKGGVFIVDGQRVRIWSGTEIGGQVINPADIELGYRFVVTGMRMWDGLIIADRVEAEPNERESLSGSVESVANALEREWTQEGFVYQGEGSQRENVGPIVSFDDRVVRAQRVLDRLVPPYLGSGDVRMYVVDNPIWNAVALPNGSIWVFTGLIEETTENELAIVLGHELAHFTHEHARRDTGPSWWKQTLASIGTGLLLGLVPGGTARDAGSVAALVGTRMWTAGYGSELEAQADRVGLRYAHEGGYDVYASLGFWMRIGARYGHMAQDSGSMLDTHVKPADRIENAKREIEVNYRYELAEEQAERDQR